MMQLNYTTGKAHTCTCMPSPLGGHRPAIHVLMLSIQNKFSIERLVDYRPNKIKH